MFIACVVVTLLAAAANIFSATLDFIRYKQVLINMAKAGVSESWITMLGILKAEGALGLLIGISVPPMGTAAAVSFVLFFIGAIITHLSGRDYSFDLAMVPSAGGRRTRVATGRHVVSKRGASGPPGLTRRGDRLDQVALTVFP